MASTGGPFLSHTSAGAVQEAGWQGATRWLCGTALDAVTTHSTEFEWAKLSTVGSIRDTISGIQRAGLVERPRKVGGPEYKHACHVLADAVCRAEVATGEQRPNQNKAMALGTARELPRAGLPKSAAFECRGVQSGQDVDS